VAPPFWVRRLVSRLRECEPVEQVYLHHDRIKVHFKDGFHRSYLFKETDKRYLYERSITKHQCVLNWPVPIHFEHEWDPFDKEQEKELDKYFHVRRETLNGCTFMDKELLVHDLILKVQNQGYIKKYITDEMVDTEINRLNQITNVYHDGVFDLYALVGMQSGAPRPAQDIIDKYYDTSDIARGGDIRRTFKVAFSRTKVLFVAFQKLIKEGKRDVSISTLHRMLYSMRYGPIWHNPALYRIILTQMFDIGPNTIIADRHPNLGEKAIACSLMGCKYMPMSKKSIPKAMASRLGLDVLPVGKADILIWDNNFKYVDVKKALGFRKLAKQMLLFVREDHARETKMLAEPDRIIKIKTNPIRTNQQPDFLFIYK
jgi:hypothetical protein